MGLFTRRSHSYSVSSLITVLKTLWYTYTGTSISVVVYDIIIHYSHNHFLYLFFSFYKFRSRISAMLRAGRGTV